MSEIQSIDQVKELLYNFFRENFPTPAHLLSWMDDGILQGEYNLYKWQAECHSRYFSIEENDKYTATDPLELCIRAVNGSGKDEKVIAPFILHFLGINKDSLVVLTSASAQQLKTQTEKYLARYVTILNAKLSKTLGLENNFEFFTHVQRNVKCNFTAGDAFLFATDEPGKAEGYHPTRSGAKMAVIVNEGKSIAEDIWEALSRCNGFTHWVEVSSPGKPDGHFFRTCTSNRTKDDNQTLAVKQVVVKSFDCPHLGGENYIRRLVEIYGSRDHYMVKSMVDADFSSSDEQVVITYDKYNNLIRMYDKIEYLPETFNTGGLDLAFGGDEIILQIRNGNKLIGTEVLVSKDTNVICETIKRWFEKWHLTSSPVYADAGGLGEPIISLLRGHQYRFKNIIPLKNNYAPQNTQAYNNLGCEMWFNLNKLIENLEILIKDEDTLRMQLCNRYYKLDSSNIACLESKQQARAKGRKSPDRADALTLCFHRYTTPRAIKFKEEKKKYFNEIIGQRITTPGAVSIKSLVQNARTDDSRRKYMQQSGIILATRDTIKSSRNDIKLELKQALENLREQIRNN